MADSSRPIPTMFGTIAERVGRSSAEQPAATAAIRYRAATGGGPSAARIASVVEVPSNRSWASIRSLRRSYRSARVPASSAAATNGTNSTRPISPTWNDDPVMMNT